MENHIRGAVFSRYPSIISFANAIGWKRTKASRILNGIQIPTVDEINKIAECLEINDAETFVSIFFPGKFTK